MVVAIGLWHHVGTGEVRPKRIGTHRHRNRRDVSIDDSAAVAQRP